MTRSTHRPKLESQQDPSLGGRLSPSENHCAATTFRTQLPPTFPTPPFCLLGGGSCHHRPSWKTLNLLDVILFFAMLTPLATTTHYLKLSSWSRLVFPAGKAECIEKGKQGALVFKKEQNDTQWHLAELPVKHWATSKGSLE